MVATKVGGRYYALQGECPRCGFDLWRGALLVDDRGGGGGAAFDDLPRVACPTCSTTYSLRNGKVGPPLKRSGLAGFVGNLAKTATATEAGKNAKAYVITRDETDGRAYCRER
jgi:nitrite reductase/ring-hydroxylating ferredoxin subunit